MSIKLKLLKLNSQINLSLHFAIFDDGFLVRFNHICLQIISSHYVIIWEYEMNNSRIFTLLSFQNLSLKSWQVFERILSTGVIKMSTSSRDCCFGRESLENKPSANGYNLFCSTCKCLKMWNAWTEWIELLIWLELKLYLIELFNKKKTPASWICSIQGKGRKLTLTLIRVFQGLVVVLHCILVQHLINQLVALSAFIIHF